MNNNQDPRFPHRRCPHPKGLYPKGPHEERAWEAERFAQLSMLFARAGMNEQAVKAAEAAIGIYRHLVEEHPKFRANLAFALTSLGTALNNLNQPEQALEPLQEAAAIHRRILGRDLIKAATIDFAITLAELSLALGHQGRHKAAVAAARLTVKIRRRLAKDDPGAFLPFLAASLNNLAIHFSTTARLEEALKAAQEAVVIYWQLHRANPGKFDDLLAASLLTLSNRLSELGQPRKARVASRMAVDILRELTEQSPGYFSLLAEELSKEHQDLFAQGQYKEALAVAEKMVLSQIVLAAGDPQRHGQGAAAALGILGETLLHLGEPVLASEAFRKGLCFLPENPDCPKLARLREALIRRDSIAREAAEDVIASEVKQNVIASEAKQNVIASEAKQAG